MSYTVTTDQPIKFEYTVTSLQEAVETITGNIASKLDDKDAETLDKYSLSADEAYQFNQFLTEAHLHVSRIIRKMALGITNALTIDLATTKKVSYQIKNKAGYDLTILPVFDQIIMNTLVNFIVKEWFIQCGLKDWAEYYNAKYQESLKMIPRYSMSLRSSSIT